jgi:hypothetical protein
MFCLAVLALGTFGCGTSGQPSGAAGGADASKDGQVTATATAAADDGPAASVTIFLEAVRTGNDAKATQMLSATARAKLEDSPTKRSVTPPASDTARFEVGKVEYIGKDGARVACTWTDMDENGKPRSDSALWVLRHEAGGWRVAGVAATVFPGEPPLLLNFEDPDDMAKKQEWLRAEVARRTQAEKSQPTTEVKLPDSMRR